MVEIYSFGYWVMRQRKALDLTRKELARKVGCASETIKKIERDERRPSRQIAELLAAALAVSPEQQKLFLQAARGERSADQLPSVSEPLQFSVAQHNLPQQITPFIGRDNEVATIDRYLADSDCRLLTLVGLGGVGKSRIALKVAENQIGLFHHGVYFVPLAGVESADALPFAIMNALGLKLEGQVRSQLIQYLREMARELLFVLDNFEQLLEATDFLIEILQNTQRVKLLVTSRERLNMQSEWVVSIEGLAFPSVETTKQIEEYAAVKLFMQTAQRVRAGFALNDAEKTCVVRICQLVDGLPLAIELAASWTRVLACQDIVRELEKGFGILATSERDVPEQHRTIYTVFDHTWNLLSDEEQCVLSQLSVFRGGFTRDAAEKVAGASLSILTALVDKSLVRVDQQLVEVQRYGAHEVVRHYAFERLLAGGEVEVERARERHLNYYVGFAEQAEPELHASDNLIWVERLERDYDNLRAAFAWAISPSRGHDGEQSQRLVGALWWFWCLRGHIEEACYWAECGLSQPVSNDLIRAKTIWVSGFLNLFHGNQAVARDKLQQGIVFCRESGQSGQQDLALALNFLAVESMSRDPAASQAYLEESLAIRRKLGDSWGIAQALMNLGFIAGDHGEFVRARSFAEEGLLEARALGEGSHVAALLNCLGWIVAQQGDVIRAKSLFCEALQVCRELRWEWKAAGVFEYFAIAESKRTHVDGLMKAARLWGVAEMLFRVWGSKYRLEDSKSEIAGAKEQLGTAAFSTAWAEGGRMTFDQAIEYALETSTS